MGSKDSLIQLMPEECLREKLGGVLEVLGFNWQDRVIEIIIEEKYWDALSNGYDTDNKREWADKAVEKVINKKRSELIKKKIGAYHFAYIKFAKNKTSNESYGFVAAKSQFHSTNTSDVWFYSEDQMYKLSPGASV